MKSKIKEKLNSLYKFTKIDIILEKIKSFFKFIIINLLFQNFTKFCKFIKLDKLFEKLKIFCHFIKLDKLFNKLKKVDKEIYIKTLILIILPILIYLYCQFFCNGKLIFEPKRMLLNFMFIYFIILFFYCIVGKIKISLYLTTVLTGIIGIVNHFITAFRGTPLVPWDLFSLNVALTVLPTFKFTVTKQAVYGFILFIITLLILFKTKFHSFRNGKRKKAYRVFAFTGVLTFTICFYLTNLIVWFDLNENWDPKEEYHNNGLVASIFKQSRNLIIKEPDGYDVDSLTKLASTIKVPISEDKNEEMPNIIVIMNESFADLTVVGDFSTNTEYLSFFNSLSENTIRGNLHVSIFGATTPNSEWEVLTSNSMAFVPKRTVPYQQYVLRKSYSLASILKEYNYSTSAIHCYYPQGYNRNLAYPRLGFDKFYSMYELKDLNYIREYPDDASTYKNIIDIYENKKDGQKMFNFTLTMQNHGSYTDENFKNTVIAENGKYPKLNQYLSLIKIADESLEELINYFSNQDEHTIIVLFGDHQPYVEDEFYNEMLAQNYEDITSKEAVENKYITPFMIWANYDIEEEKYSNLTDISTNYLSSLILDVANIQKTPYLQFLDELRKEIPIITGNGYMDKEGIYHDFSEKTVYSKLIENYHYLQFNNMFDNSNKLTSLFEIPTQLTK